MFKYLAGLGLGIGIFSAAILINSASKKSQFAQADRSKTKTGKWIMYNPKDLSANHGVKTMSVSGAKQIEGLNAYVFDQEPPKVKVFADEGWVSVEEKVYHVMDWSCACKTCTPTDPGPQPNPTPAPTPGINTTWGQKAIHAGEAQGLIDPSGITWCLTDTGLDQSVHDQFAPGSILQGISYVPNEQWQVDGGKHGTHVSGTVASLKYGIAPKAKTLVCKGLANNGSGASSWLASCIQWCANHGAKIINASWGMDQGTDPFIGAAIDAAVAGGVKFVAAAGNSSGPIGFPGSKANVITATAMTEQGGIATFSSRGIKAGGEMYLMPGQNILSLWPGGTNTISGTSMAAPHLTGAIIMEMAAGKIQLKTINKGLQPSEQGKGMADVLDTVR